jgi:hypothetical protein
MPPDEPMVNECEMDRNDAPPGVDATHRAVQDRGASE